MSAINLTKKEHNGFFSKRTVCTMILKYLICLWKVLTIGRNFQLTPEKVNTGGGTFQMIPEKVNTGGGTLQMTSGKVNTDGGTLQMTSGKINTNGGMLQAIVRIWKINNNSIYMIHYEN